MTTLNLGPLTCYPARFSSRKVISLISSRSIASRTDASHSVLDLDVTLALVVRVDVVGVTGMSAELGHARREALDDPHESSRLDSLRPRPSLPLAVEVAAKPDCLGRLTKRNPQAACQVKED